MTTTTAPGCPFSKGAAPGATCPVLGAAAAAAAPSSPTQHHLHTLACPVTRHTDAAPPADPAPAARRGSVTEHFSTGPAPALEHHQHHYADADDSEHVPLNTCPVTGRHVHRKGRMADPALVYYDPELEPLVCPVTGATNGAVCPVTGHAAKQPLPKQLETPESRVLPTTVLLGEVVDYAKQNACVLAQFTDPSDPAFEPFPAFGMLALGNQPLLLIRHLLRLPDAKGALAEWEHYLRVGDMELFVATLKQHPEDRVPLTVTQYPVLVTNIDADDEQTALAVLVDGFDAVDVRTGKVVYYNEMATTIQGAITTNPTRFRPRAVFATSALKRPDTPPTFTHPLNLQKFPDLTGHAVAVLAQQYGAMQELRFRFFGKIDETKVLQMQAWREEHPRFGLVVHFQMVSDLVPVVDGALRLA